MVRSIPGDRGILQQLLDVKLRAGVGFEDGDDHPVILRDEVAMVVFDNGTASDVNINTTLIDVAENCFSHPLHGYGIIFRIPLRCDAELVGFFAITEIVIDRTPGA